MRLEHSLKLFAKTTVPLVVALVVLLVAAGMTPQMARAQAKEGSPEKLLFDSANRERAARGLSLLRWDDDLAKAARQHAIRMVDHNALSHQFPEEPDLAARAKQAGANFIALAENVAYGPTAAGLHEQWMQSPPHRENLLDPKLNALGVAVEDRNGQLFAVEDFSQAVASLTLEEQGSELAALLKARGLSIASDSADAQQACKQERGYNFSHRPSFVLRYSTADLKSLPDVLLRELQSGHYRAAAVAACAHNQPGNFAGYQLAILLYE
jgi:uncharacterized protein YkwD